MIHFEHRNPDYDANDRSVLDLVVIYDADDAGARAKKVIDSVVRNFSSNWKFNLTMWQFDQLSAADARAQAARDAEQSDIMIVSVQDHEGLPSDVSRWIESWAGRGERHPTALVAMVKNSEPLDALNPVRAYLRKVAQEAGIDFFVQPTKTATGEPRHARETTVEDIDRDMDYPTGPFHRWGIND